MLIDVQQMLQFKEIAFVRLKSPGKTAAKNVIQERLKEIKAVVEGLLQWSIHYQRYQIQQVFLNYENKAIYNNGIVVHRTESGQYQVQMLTSVPRELSTITVGTPFSQPKNYLNYTFEKSHFHTNPVPFFESMGYKIQNSFESKQTQNVEYFKNISFGIEIVIFPSYSQLQIIETHLQKPELDDTQSAGNQLLKMLADHLEEGEVIISSENMKPNDFVQEKN